MKDVIESIKKTNYSECHIVECIKEYKIEYKTSVITFKQNEHYTASKINDNWWLIEQFGIPTKDFKKYFKNI